MPQQPQHVMVLLDSNAAIVSQLKQMQQTKQKFGSQDPGSALAARFQVRCLKAPCGSSSPVIRLHAAAVTLQHSSWTTQTTQALGLQRLHKRCSVLAVCL
jgi:hypothetical protein